jgi:hypothetical protein
MIPLVSGKMWESNPAKTPGALLGILKPGHVTGDISVPRRIVFDGRQRVYPIR